MKILLIQPKKPEKAVGGEDFSIFEPLALEYLASGLVNDHDVKILDMRIEDDLDSVLNSFNPHIVGITAYTVHVNVVKQLFERVKGFNPDIFTVVGGHHATVMPEDFIVSPIDVIITGEGVFSFKAVITNLELNKDYDSIPGIVLRKNGTIITNRNQPIDNLDGFPFPQRTLTEKYRKHYFSEWMKPLASIRTSKGCLYKCNFCALWKLTGGRYLIREPQNILDELLTIKEDFVFFADDESLLDTDRMETLASLIKEAGIRKRYFLYGRSDTIAKHPALIEKWKDIGLARVFVGLEFFRDEDLRHIRKGSTTKDNREALTILQALEIDIFPSFMVKPEFDKADFTELRKHCLSLGLNFIGFPVMTPLPGTDLYDEVKSSLITNDYDFFDFIHTLMPTRLPLKEFYKEYMALYNRTRSISNQIAFLRKYSARELPSLIRAYFKFTRRFKNIHKDYNNL